MADSKKKSKIGYGNLNKIDSVIQSGVLDEYDIVFTKDTHEIVFITPEKTQMRVKARINYDSIGDAKSDAYAGQIITVLEDGKYIPYIVQPSSGDDEELILSPLPSSNNEQVVTRRTEPYATEAGTVFACGVPIIISDAEDGAHNLISWYTNNGKIKTLEVPVGQDVYGGSEESGSDQEITYPSASIQMNSGKVTNIFGGGNGACSIGSTTVIVNGGTIDSVSGGGCTGLKKDNHVGLSHVVINNCDSKPQIFGGSGEGYATTTESVVEINSGSFSYVTLGGSNGYTTCGKVIVNGGSIDVLQGGNRGQLSDVEFDINGGSIRNLYVIGEGGNTDPSDDPIVQNIKLKLIGGKISNIDLGDKLDNISCVYTSGIINPDDAPLASITNKTEIIPPAKIKEYIDSMISIVEF